MLSLTIIFSAASTVSAGYASASVYDGQTYKIGDFEYDPDMKTFEDWQKKIPDLLKCDINGDGEFVIYGNERFGNTYMQLKQPVGVRAALTVRKGETVILNLNGWRCINFAERGTMIEVEEGGTLFIIDSHTASGGTYIPDGYIFSNIKDAIIAKVNGNIAMLGGFLECTSGPDSGGYNMYIGEKGVVHLNGGGLLRNSAYSHMYANSSLDHIDPKSNGEIHLYNGYVLSTNSSYDLNPLYDKKDKVFFHTEKIYTWNECITPEEAFSEKTIWGNFVFGDRFIYDKFTPTPKGEDMGTTRLKTRVGETAKIDLRYYYGICSPADSGISSMLNRLGYEFKKQYRIYDSDHVTDLGTSSDYIDGDTVDNVVKIKGKKPGKYYVVVKYSIDGIGFSRQAQFDITVTEEPVDEVTIITSPFEEYRTDFTLEIPNNTRAYELVDPGKWAESGGTELVGEPKRGVIYYRKVTLKAKEGRKFDSNTEITVSGARNTNVKSYASSISADGKIFNVYLMAHASHSTHKWQVDYDDNFHWSTCVGCSTIRDRNPHHLETVGPVGSDGKADFRCTICKYTGRLDVASDEQIISSVTVMLEAPRQGDTAEKIAENMTLGATNLMCCDITDITFKNADDSAFESAEKGKNIKYTVKLRAKDGYIFASDLKPSRRFPDDLSGKATSGATVSADGKTAEIAQTIPGNKILISATVKFKLPSLEIGDSFSSKVPEFSCDTGGLDTEKDGYLAQVMWKENEKTYLVMFDSDGTFYDLSSNGLTEAPIYKNDISYEYFALPKNTKTGYEYSYETVGEGTAYPGTVGEGKMFLLLGTAPCGYGQYFKAEDENKIMDVSLSLKQPKKGDKPSKITLPLYANYTVTEAVFKDSNGKIVDTFDSGKYTLTVKVRANDGAVFSPLCTYSINGNTVTAEGTSDNEKIITAYFDIKKDAGRVSGNIKSYGDKAKHTVVTLTESGQTEPKYKTELLGNSSSYSFTDVTPGKYTLTVSKKDHVSQSIEIDVTDGGLFVNDFELHLYGDANSDGKITAADVLLIRKFIAGQSVILNETAADVNCDGKLTASDVSLIRKFIAGQHVTLGKAKS